MGKKDFYKIYNLVTNKKYNFLKKLNNLLDKNLKVYSQKKNKLYKEHDIENIEKFSFFELISDLYYREKFHSDILFAILNKNTPQIGHDNFLNLFVKYLGIPKELFNPEINYEIKLEHSTGKISPKESEIGKLGFIDILIYNDSQALIIENKINYAEDMENQLVRYMKYVEEELEIKKYAVIYLTLTDDKNKKPPLNSYSKEFSYYTEKLKNEKEKILYESYAVGENSLSNIFLKDCLKDLPDEANFQVATVFLEQYKILLDHEGGFAYMKNLEMDTLSDIIFDSEKNKIAEDFFELWMNYRNGYVSSELIQRYVSENSNLKFDKKEIIHGCSEYLWKKENYCVYWDGEFEVGFCSFEDQKFTKEQQDFLEKKLSLDNIKKIQKNDNWVWSTVTNNSNSYILKNLIKILTEINKV